MKVKTPTVRTIVLAALAILVLTAYWYFTRQPLTDQIRWTDRWIWTLPWAIPSFFDALVALTICACVFFFWRKKENSFNPEDSKEAERFFGLTLSMIVGAIVGLIMTIVALYDSASAPKLISFFITSAGAGLFLGLFWYGPEQNVWEDDFKTSFKLALYGIKREILVMTLGLGLGAATTILPTFGTVPAMAVITISIITVPIATFTATLINFGLQGLFGPTAGKWFCNQKVTGGF